MLKDGTDPMQELQALQHRASNVGSAKKYSSIINFKKIIIKFQYIKKFSTKTTISIDYTKLFSTL